MLDRASLKTCESMQMRTQAGVRLTSSLSRHPVPVTAAGFSIGSSCERLRARIAVDYEPAKLAPASTWGNVSP